MSDKQLHIRFTADLLATIDKAASKNHQKRSQFIRESIVLRLNEQHVVTHKPKAIDWQAIMAEDDV
jgi:uncharacterized protein (DUF1778 family)